MTNRIDAWTNDLREVLQDPASPLSLKNGLWEVKDRKGLWQTLGSRLYDEDLDRLKDCAVEVLTERDPKFDLPPQERYAAAIYEKQLQYSYELRKGLAECLALMSTRPQVLTHCSLHKAVHTAAAAVRDILHDDDWVLCGVVLTTFCPSSLRHHLENSSMQSIGPSNIVLGHSMIFLLKKRVVLRVGLTYQAY